MGKHVNGDAGVDSGLPDTDLHDTDIHDGEQQQAARHVASELADDGVLDQRAVISSDTHVGVDFGELPAGTPDAAPSPAHPEALVEHGKVGDGHEME